MSSPFLADLATEMADVLERSLHGGLTKKDLGRAEDIVKPRTLKFWGHEVEIYDLSQPFGAQSVIWPTANGSPEFSVVRNHAFARARTIRICSSMHVATHMDAPIHVEEGYPSIDQIPLDRMIGEGVIISIPKKEWEIIKPEDLEKARPEIQEGDIVVINTGWHKYFADAARYYLFAPGLYKEGAEWLLKKKIKGLAQDVQATDHPLATVLVQGNMGQGNPPVMPWLADLYKKKTGRDVREDFPYWEPSHRILYTHGIWGIENAGGDIDKVTGKRALIAAFPIKWVGGDASMVRLVAMVEKK
ncbi:MAG: cyclase family protein [Conexivisphaera sp.]|jgi:kynurenine formamidase|nr:cyclase family protein [Conexivisphaerales archaeon]